MPTRTERRIIQERKMKQKGGLIVPLLNELLTRPLGIENETDAEWLHTLALKQVERDRIRAESYRKDEMVFSPSGLASCLRRVYLSKNHKKYGLERVDLPAIEPHFYFFTGDFLHLKWQFAFYKLSIACEDFRLVDVEMPIMSKRKDHGGTLDVLCLLKVKGKWQSLIVDVKGLNVRSFNSIDQDETPHDYRIQLTDYMMLFNSALQGGRWKPAPEMLAHTGLTEFPKVKRGVLLAENKGGPDLTHPAALTETIVDLKSNLPEVKARLEVLRQHDEEEEIPEAECVSTRLIAFTGCPFAGYCRKEVQANERARAKTRGSKEIKVARPSRRRRSR